MNAAACLTLATGSAPPSQRWAPVSSVFEKTTTAAVHRFFRYVSGAPPPLLLLPNSSTALGRVSNCKDDMRRSTYQVRQYPTQERSEDTTNGWVG